MIKKLLVAALSFTIIFSTFTPVYADKSFKTVKKVKKVKSGVFELVNAKSTKTMEKEQVIYGKAKQDTSISLSLSWLKPAQEKSIISNKDKETSADEENGEWIEYDNESWTVGASEFFAQSVNLKIGKNKLVFDVKATDGKKDSKELLIEVIDKKQLTDAITDMVIGNIDKEYKK